MKQRQKPIAADFHWRHSARKLSQTLTFASICGEESGIYIDKIEARDFGIRLHSEIGKSFPLHCTAMGKIHLAFGPQKLRDHILASKLDAYTEATITTPETLTAELERVRTQGYAIDDEEISRGLTCIGAPIYGLNGEVIAALSLTAPSHIYENGRAKFDSAEPYI